MKKSRRHHRTDEDSNEGEDGASKEISTAQVPEAGGEDEEKAISQSRRKHRHRRKEIDPIKASRRKSRLCIGETLGNLSDEDDEDEDEDGGNTTNTTAAKDDNYDDDNGEVKKRKSKRKQGIRKESISTSGDKMNSQSASEENSNNSASFIDTCDIEVEIPRNKLEKSNTVITNPSNIKKDGIIYQKPHLAKPLPPSKAAQRTQYQTPSSTVSASPLSKSIQISAPPQSSSSKRRNNNSGENDRNSKDDYETRKSRSSTMLRAANIRTLGGADDDLSFVPATDTASGGNVFTAASEYTPNYQSLLTPRTFYVSRLADKDIATHANTSLDTSHGSNDQNGNNNGGSGGKCYNEDCSECCWRKYMDYKAISYLQKLEEFYSARSIAIVETEGLPNGSNGSNGNNTTTTNNNDKKSKGKKGNRNSGVLKLNFGGSKKDGASDDDDDDDSTDDTSADDVSTDVSEYDDDEDDDDAFVDGFRDAELATNFEDPFNFVRLEDVVEPDDIWEELRTGAPLLTRTLVTDEGGAQGSNPSTEEFLRKLRDSFLSGDCTVLGRPRYTIQSGSLNRLVQCLTPEDGHTDPTYVAAFMLT